jgi:hypothetical protein
LRYVKGRDPTWLDRHVFNRHRDVQKEIQLNEREMRDAKHFYMVQLIFVDTDGRGRKANSCFKSGMWLILAGKEELTIYEPLKGAYKYRVSLGSWTRH